MPTPNYPDTLQGLSGIGSLTVSDMEQAYSESPRQADCLLDTWYRLRRDAMASHAMHKESVLSASDAHLLHTMQAQSEPLVGRIGAALGRMERGWGDV